MTKPLLRGVLKTWKEDRGFGFISPDNAGRDVFIHISALDQTDRRPVPGDIVHYQVARDKHGKFRAINASIEGVSTQNKTTRDTTKAKPTYIWLIAAVITLLAISAGIAFMYYRSGDL